MAIALLTLPWVAVGGSRRADLEQQLAAVASDWPIGRVYFQRVNRATVALADAGVLARKGQRYELTPEGFGSLVLNLYTLRCDPTLDAQEFEFKREVIAMWQLSAERCAAVQLSNDFIQNVTAFLDAVEALAINGLRVFRKDVLVDAFNVIKFIGRARERVQHLLDQANERLTLAKLQMDVLQYADLSQLSQLSVPGMPDNSDLVAAVQAYATSGVHEFNSRARLARYRAYLDYLGGLETMHRDELGILDLDDFRRRLLGT